MFVIAAKGLKVPKEFKPHDYIEQRIVEVPDDSAYYARRMTDGDLIASTEAEFNAQQAEASAAEDAAEKQAKKQQTK